VTSADTAPYLLGLRLAGRLVVVVGGGGVALRRVSALLAAGAQVRIVAAEVTPALDDLAARDRVALTRRGYADGDLDGAWLAVAATSDPAVNAEVGADAERRRVWCVRSDDATAATAWVPATGQAGPFTVGVHAGRDPRRAAAARDLAVAALVEQPPPPVREPPPAGRVVGRVVLVGGGPGDPGLLTVRGWDRLREADVVVTDRLAPLPMLDRLPPSVRVVDASKVPGGRAMPQEEINRTLVAHARAGRVVVRLKGGDPFVLGRGMEEVQACLAAGIPVEVVPGVSSALALPGLAGVPVTHRGVAQSFTVVSGHLPPGAPGSTVDWSALARSGGTLVLLMAVTNLPQITGALLAAGMPATTPVASIEESGIQPGRLRRAELGAVPDGALADVRAPAVIVIGAVVGVAPGADLSGDSADGPSAR
jgi:uroporphyrin-III C-methyltransferase / precorrin-2 dehydrogenase / sirohydrochlorin ferrochelatase